MKTAWVAKETAELHKLVEAARALNNDQGMLDPEIQICHARIDYIRLVKVEKFRRHTSEDSNTINFRKFYCDKVLNNTPEDRTVYLLGRMKGDITGSKAIAILTKTEFKPAEIS